MANLTKAERETHLWWNEAERTWRASTEVGMHARRLARMGWKHVENGEWEAPDGSVLIRKADRPKRAGSHTAFQSKNRHPSDRA